ncbi:MAG: alpha/beta hydrolase [Actinomycetota bacterium]|nr:alpha/beta hydrolase [Actinomycetota bacterium]
MADPPVLLVHGFASSFERNWRDPGWVDLLTDAGRRVRGVDLLGHGTAPKPHDPMAYADMQAAIVDQLDDGEAVDAIGFSLGAGLLLAVAAQRPQSFRRLVVGGVGASLFAGNDGEGRGSRSAGAFALARAIETGQVDEGAPSTARAFIRFSQGSGNDPLALAACLRRPITPLRPASLAAVIVPVLVVLGDRDFAGPAEPLLDALPDARLVTLGGADHFGTAKDFRFLDAALGFVGAVPG